MPYRYQNQYLAGFSPDDGTIDFYLRVGSLISSDSVVLDLGAGRASWRDVDECDVRRSIRDLKGRAGRVVAADIDKVVLQNQASDEQVVITQNKIAFEEHSADVVISDFVLEHIDDVGEFSAMVDYCLKSGGWFCARTPFKFSYISIASRFIKNKYHARALELIQPGRKAEDVFPAHYKLNTFQALERSFMGWESQSFLYRPEPSYFFGSKVCYHMLAWLHRMMPVEFSGVMYVFLKKPH